MGDLEKSLSEARFQLARAAQTEREQAALVRRLDNEREVLKQQNEAMRVSLERKEYVIQYKEAIWE